MKIDYNQTLENFDGTPFKMDGSDEPMTVGRAISIACNAMLKGDEAMGPMDKYEVGKIGHLVNKGLPLTVEQLKIAKERCGNVFVPGLVFDLYNKIEASVEE